MYEGTENCKEPEAGALQKSVLWAQQGHCTGELTRVNSEWPLHVQGLHLLSQNPTMDD